jgi:membrane-bound ClpP family serine protease
MTPLVWAILLFVAALAFVALELFLPSGGLLGLMAVVAVIGSLVFVIYDIGYLAGTIYLVFLAIFVPVLIVAGLNYWPHTSVGRKILNVSPDGEGEPPVELRNAHLVGKRGVALTKMLPSGAVKIEGKSYDAIDEGAGLESGDPIEVIRVDGTRIVVRHILGDAADALVNDVSQDDQVTGDDLLSRPISEVIPDPFDEPPA